MKNALSGVVKKLRRSAKWVKNTLRVWFRLRPVGASP